MAGQNQGPNMELFETYFRRADLDGDGRINGNEARAFFQGANLANPVLAQIWMYADQSRSGFLGRTEFYNALKLVTVAQSKRELTPDIVKAALYSQASAKIPPPQINLSATPGPPVNLTVAASTQQMGAVVPTASQNLGFRGPGVPNAGISQNYFPSQQNQAMRPPQGIPVLGMGGGDMVRPGGPNPNISSDWVGARTGGASVGPRGSDPSIPSSTSISQPPFLTSSQPMTTNSKALVSGNGFASDSVFGGDVFSTAPSKKQESSFPTNSASSAAASSAIAPVTSVPQPPDNSSSFNSMQSAFSMQPSGGYTQRPQSPLNPASSAVVPVDSGPQPSGRSGSVDSLRSASPMQPSGGQIQWAQTSLNPSQQVSQGSSVAPSGLSTGVGNSTSNNSQWRKMKPSDVQKYTKVFMEVDSDRDGKITGLEARNLFLSWRLPREILKQVWDLSDQDNDSMLSLREFCFALYLMERYREGCPLPTTLPRNVMFDETLLSMTGQPNVNYGNASWGPRPGFGAQQGMPGARPAGPPTGLRPSMPGISPHVDSTMHANQQKSRVPVSHDPFSNGLNNREQSSMDSKPQEADVGEKVEGKENIILDSKEKIEFYRTKMQELVLYKSRCDNRLNEITERAIADKREAETQGKKYEEKYKQVAEIASKLTMEEARFREIQERKVELQQAIVNMEQGGSADGILQVRADRIQSDLEELLKALAERCKKHGLNVKSTAIIDLPTGWQPGIQESASLWDEDWDKFEDEGFENEVTFDKNVSNSKTKSTSNQREITSPDDSLTSDSLSNANTKGGNSFGNNNLESEYTHSEDERSPPGSPAGRTAFDSPKEFSDVNFGKSTEADAESHRSFDESTWGGGFDNNDDVDSVWGFNPTKESDSDKHNFFDSGDFRVSPVRTGSPPQADNSFKKNSPIFEDSVPNTPHSKFNNSPPRYSEGFSDSSFSRFDSFGMHDGGGFSPQPEKLTRFDSINSTKDFQSRGGGFSSFDDSDPFGSSGAFKVSSPKKSSDHWSSF